MLKSESQTSEKHLAYTVRLDSLQQEVKAKCLENKDTCANEVLARIEYARDLTASSNVYHQSCSIKLRLVMDPGENCYEPPVKKRNTVSSKSFDMKGEDVFFASCKLFMGK